MYCHAGVPSTSPSPTDFSEVHKILCGHIKQGNNFSVAAAVALEPLHGSSEFWRTCGYRSGIVSALLASSLGVQRETDQLSHLEPMTVADVYAMFRHVVDENAHLRQIIARLESGECDPDDGSGGITSSAERLRSLISEGYDALTGRSSPCMGEDDCGQTPGKWKTCSNGAAGTKRRRDSPEVTERAYVRPESPVPASETLSPAANSGDDTVDEAEQNNALDVLEQLPALPGTTRTVSSFDAVGEMVNRGAGGPSLHPTNPSEFRVGSERGSTIETHSSSELSNFANVGVGTSSGKQKRYKFSASEDEAIIKGLARFTKGQQRFQQIYYAYRSVWHPARTVSQLYDHWRGTLRYKVIQQQGYRGKNSVAARSPEKASNMENNE
ncbi:hypothetical protein, conserved [Trypanosoma brucei gambiense DAL972]|uniref:Microspherule protein N-terminal domain-containing protein n=2 Tax=Trypanosoma brucei TaxID=5691 RepID=D0A5A7_TRYB9|nr:hypothetical protein, conserved [Trypanosoma brucei gambiense DAL972]RHW69733.1 ttaggg binding factor [Trypanosoma brucei equiperdum]CBH16451.1 hypothetical protein, conserved [Trypanosoma brucei gambiense DAL972]|eukprot:XP_011778715.1 hypothetical protein, conserved [Trypanosoma brucei gambiense DAL972]